LGYLPTLASRTCHILESLSAGATRRANLAREAVVNAAWGYINALRSVSLAGTLSWVFVCFVLSPLLFVLRPFIPAILRKYFLWRNWVEARLGDFVDSVCVDIGRQIERRRLLEARLQLYRQQVARLDTMNTEVNRIAWNATDAFVAAGKWFKGKYEHLAPTEFNGRVATVVPEEGPAPTLGLWFRLRNRIDMDVYVADLKIRRIDSAMERNQLSLADLEHQTASRSAELWAIKDQVRNCERHEREKFRRSIIARPDQICSTASSQATRVVRVREVTTTRPPPTAATTTATVTTIVAAEPSPSRELVPVAAVASPDPAYVPPPFSRRPLPHPSRRPILALPPPPPSPPSTTPQSLEERLLADAHRQLERTVV
jgi:hypothetical protein